MVETNVNNLCNAATPEIKIKQFFVAFYSFLFQNKGYFVPHFGFRMAAKRTLTPHFLFYHLKLSMSSLHFLLVYKHKVLITCKFKVLKYFYKTQKIL